MDLISIASHNILWFLVLLTPLVFVHEFGHFAVARLCGVRVEDIKEPLMQEIRYLDKLIDELAKNKPMEKILRKEQTLYKPNNNSYNYGY